MLLLIQISSIICVLAICATLVLSIDDDDNAHGMMMKAQSKLIKSSILNSIQKKVMQANGKYCNIAL